MLNSNDWVIIEEALAEYAESPAAPPSLKGQVLETLGRVRLARAMARQELLDEAALIRSLKENRERAWRPGTFWEKPESAEQGQAPGEPMDPLGD